VKNNSGISGEHEMNLENESLSPYLEGLSLVEMEDLITKFAETGDSGHIGDKLNIPAEEKEKEKDRYSSRETPSSNIDGLIGYRAPFYYCKEHLKFENIHKEEVIDHIQHHKERDLKLVEKYNLFEKLN